MHRGLCLFLQPPRFLARIATRQRAAVLLDASGGQLCSQLRSLLFGTATRGTRSAAGDSALRPPGQAAECRCCARCFSRASVFDDLMIRRDASEKKRRFTVNYLNISVEFSKTSFNRRQVLL